MILYLSTDPKGQNTDSQSYQNNTTHREKLSCEECEQENRARSFNVLTGPTERTVPSAPAAAESVSNMSSKATYQTVPLKMLLLKPAGDT